MSTNQSIWTDFETLRHNVRTNKVDALKQIIAHFNEECHSNIARSGRKQDLIDRVTQELDMWKRAGNAESYAKGRAILTQVRQYGTYNPGRTINEPAYASGSSYPPPAPNHGYQHPNGNASTSSLPQYNAYAPPRRPAPNPSVVAAPIPAPPPAIRFKPSPFFRVERNVSSVIECPESTSAVDRRSQALTFTITTDLVAKLHSTSPAYQLRLYCTSSAFHAPGGFRMPSGGCPIEFPPTCEVRINGHQLLANLKGLKKKPGTAPPPDLGKEVRTTAGASNRVELIYVNSQQPVQAKKYYMVVMLVEVTTVDQLIDRLKKGKRRSKEDILAKMVTNASEDDDIVAGHQRMSLKCPLSYMRIQTPCRSSACVHSQCFDALSWYSIMEQTTTWLCPVCEKTLNVEDLIVDGYFDDILSRTTEDVEDVIVEADGQWHTSDNKYGSDAWKATHPPVPPTPKVKQRSQSPVKVTTISIPKDRPRPSNAEIVVLDSDDEDEGRVKRELSPTVESIPGPSQSRSVSSSQPPGSQSSDIIDLTLDSEDEDFPPPRRSALSQKRPRPEGDSSPTEPIWKKSRTDELATSMPYPPHRGHQLLSELTVRTFTDPVTPSAQSYPRPPNSGHQYPSSSQPAARHSSGSQNYQSDRFPTLPAPPTSLPRRPAHVSHDHTYNTLNPVPYSNRASGSGSHQWRQ